MRIKGQGYVSKEFCKKIAKFQRQKFSLLLKNQKIKTKNNSSIKSDFDIISVSGKKHFEEQVLSIISFVENVGIPEKWIIFSDGSYESYHIQTFHSIFSFVEVREWSDNKLQYQEYSEPLNRYTNKYPIGRKTYTIINYKSNKPFLFCDSDIVFYNKFNEYLHLFKNNGFNYFSVDNDWCCLDVKYMETVKQDMYQLNSGLLFIQPDFNWKPALDYIRLIDGDYSFFDQTSIHIAFFSNQNKEILPFDPRVFKVELSDHFKVRMASNTLNLGIRHYVGPVRHKMWQKGWIWHIK